MSTLAPVGPVCREHAGGHTQRKHAAQGGKDGQGGDSAARRPTALRSPLQTARAAASGQAGDSAVLSSSVHHTHHISPADWEGILAGPAMRPPSSVDQLEAELEGMKATALYRLQQQQLC